MKDYESYFDFPGPVNRVRWIFERVAKRGLASGRIGVEEPRPGRLHQIKLGAPKAEIVDAGDLVDELRWVKDDDEIRIMRRAMYFADFNVQAGRDFVKRNGSVTEDQILKASADALADKMSKELKDVVGVGIDAAVRRTGAVRQTLGDSARHAEPGPAEIRGRVNPQFWAQVGGYNVECERSFYVGKPTDYARRLFDAMLAAHDVAAENMKVGAVAEDVDKKGLDQIRKAGFEKFLRHRTGHGIGLQSHEPPWIAEGDKTVLTEGMTFSCEPGVYDPEWGGFRHSDTVVVERARERS